MDRPGRQNSACLDYGRLDPLPARQSNRILVERVTRQLQSLRKVPFTLREYGAIAMTEMFAASDPAYAAIYRGVKMSNPTAQDHVELGALAD